MVTVQIDKTRPLSRGYETGVDGPRDAMMTDVAKAAGITLSALYKLVTEHSRWPERDTVDGLAKALKTDDLGVVLWLKEQRRAWEPRKYNKHSPHGAPPPNRAA
jgi:hypothetical protein